MTPSAERPVPPSLHAAMAVQFAVGGAFLPFVTLFLRDHGLSYEEVSWIHLTSAAVGTAIPFLWGLVADRWLAVDRLLALLHLGGAAALLVFSLQATFPRLLVAYAVMFALYPPTSALISALAYHNLASPDVQFGKLRLWGSVGWMLPSLPIYLWFALARDMPGASLASTVQLAAGLEILAAAVALRLPRTPPAARGAGTLEDTARGAGTAEGIARPAGTGDGVARGADSIRGVQGAEAVQCAQGAQAGPDADLRYGPALRRLLSKPGFVTFLAVIFLVHSSFAVLFYYSPPLLEGAGFARKWIGPLQCVGVAAEVPFLFALAWVIRRLGYGGTIALGCTTLLLRQLVYAAPSPPWLLAASYVLAGACVAFYLTAVSLALNAMAERSVRVTAQTLFALTGPGLGQMFGHLSLGWIATRSGRGLTAGFLFAAATVGLALCILAFALRGKGLFSGAGRGAGRATGKGTTGKGT